MIRILAVDVVVVNINRGVSILIRIVGYHRTCSMKLIVLESRSIYKEAMYFPFSALLFIHALK